MRGAALLLAGGAVGAVVTTLLTVPFPVLPGADPRVDVARDFTAAQLAREEAFHSAVRPWSYASLGLTLVVALVLALTGVGARLVGGVPGPWWVRVAGGTALLLAIGRLVSLPLDVRVQQVLREYGLSTRSWVGWVDDQLRALGISVALTALLLVLLLALVRRFPDGWWLGGSVLAASLVVAGSFAYPVLVEPAFNSFTPLQDGPLRSSLLAMAERDGVPIEDVLVADASKRTTSLNAYVSGIGSTRRVVLYDTLVRDAPQAEVELVVAHELGHAKRQDVLHGTIIGAFGAVVAVCALALLLQWSGLLARIGASGPGDPRVVPLLLALGVVVPFVLAPLTNVVSRHVEARADLHSLELTGDVATFVQSEQRLATTNLSDLEPAWLSYQLFATHPSSPERIALAREWERLHP